MNMIDEEGIEDRDEENPELDLEKHLGGIIVEGAEDYEVEAIWGL